MKLVIDIPEEEYRWITKSDETVFADVASKECMLHAIKNGTPLPKGHGDLVDRNELIRRFGVKDATKYGNETAEQQTHSYSTMMMYEIADVIDDADAIIEAEEVGE